MEGCSHLLLQFQSTFPRGERRDVYHCASCRQRYFNPRSRVGNDDRLTDPEPGQDKFQSTFPRGERQRSNPGFVFPWDFNPRSRVGNDGVCDIERRKQKISIHVPAWGTTALTKQMHLAFLISIHVPAWGTTCCQSGFLSRSYHFNPRSRVGNDTAICLPGRSRSHFNPRSRVGNDGNSNKR